MGGSLSSPLGGRGPHLHHASHTRSNGGGTSVVQSTSVCNHLFSPPDGSIYHLSSNSSSSSIRQPHWPTSNWQSRKQHVHPEDRREQKVLKIERNGEHVHSRAPFVSPPRQLHHESLPYATLQLSLDGNCNYSYASASVNYSSTGGNGTMNGVCTRNGAVIPNLYTISREPCPDRSSLRSSSSSGGSQDRHDWANNNHHSNHASSHSFAASPPLSAATTPLSPTHQPAMRMGTRILDVVERERRQSLRSSHYLPSPTDKEAPTVHAPIEVRRRTIMHASTSDLLRGIGRFVVKKAKIDNVDVAHVVMWMRAVDRSLLLQGWQDIAFINPANLVFVFLLMRDVDDDDDCLYSTEGVHQWVLTCLYIAYSYMGNEISYPLKPFLVQKDRSDFWSKCVSLSLSASSDMLRLNSSSAFFSAVFADLKKYAVDV